MKILIQRIFLIVAFIPFIWCKLASLVGDSERIFGNMTQFLSLFPGTSGSYLRAAFCHLALECCSQNCEIGFLATFASSTTCIGDRVILSTGVNIGRCKIGDDCLIGVQVMITGGQNQHRFDRRDMPIRLQGGEYNVVTIGRDCWIGNGAIIMADVGEGCVVAAGSVVTKPVPPFSIVAGVPAKVIGPR